MFNRLIFMQLPQQATARWSSQDLTLISTLIWPGSGRGGGDLLFSKGEQGQNGSRTHNGNTRLWGYFGFQLMHFYNPMLRKLSKNGDFYAIKLLITTLFIMKKYGNN